MYDRPFVFVYLLPRREFISRTNFLILSFGTTAPHALSCPPPEPPNSEETADTNFPRCVLHVGEPRTDIAYIPLSTRSL